MHSCTTAQQPAGSSLLPTCMCEHSRNVHSPNTQMPEPARAFQLHPRCRNRFLEVERPFQLHPRSRNCCSRSKNHSSCSLETERAVQKMGEHCSSLLTSGLVADTPSKGRRQVVDARALAARPGRSEEQSLRAKQEKRARLRQEMEARGPLQVTLTTPSDSLLLPLTAVTNVHHSVTHCVQSLSTCCPHTVCTHCICMRVCAFVCKWVGVCRLGCVRVCVCVRVCTCAIS